MREGSRGAGEDPVLDCELIGVTRRYGDVVALEDVSFGVHHGEFVTLLGPSGGGKSSTLQPD